MKMSVLKQVRKMCVLACVLSMLVTLVACGSIEEPASDSLPASSGVVSELPEADTEVSAETEEVAEVSTETEEATEVSTETEEATEVSTETEETTDGADEAEETEEESEPEVIDVNKLAKKVIEYMSESGSYYREHVYSYNEAGILLKQESTTYSNGEIDEQDIFEYTYDESGNLIQQFEKSGDASDGYMYWATTITSYDTEGKILKVDLEGIWDTSVTDYIYDEAGYLVEKRKTSEGYEGEEEISRTYYTNDSHGNVIKTLDVDAYGYESEPYSYNQYEYYEDGTVKKSKNYVTSTDALRGVLEYDEEGRCIVDEYWSDGVCNSRLIKKYDEKGNVILIQQYRLNSDSEMALDYESIFSEEDNTFTYRSYDDDGSVKYSDVKMWNCEFPEYDENGVLVSKKVYSDSNSEYYYLYDYEYDENGNLIKETCHSYYFDDNGKINSWTEYYY